MLFRYHDTRDVLAMYCRSRIHISCEGSAVDERSRTGIVKIVRYLLQIEGSTGCHYAVHDQNREHPWLRYLSPRTGTYARSKLPIRYQSSAVDVDIARMPESGPWRNAPVILQFPVLPSRTLPLIIQNNLLETDNLLSDAVNNVSPAESL